MAITHWKSGFDERELKEIEFCRVYAKDFCHGALGHNVMLIVAKLANILDDNQLVVPDTTFDFYEHPIAYGDKYDPELSRKKEDGTNDIVVPDITFCPQCGKPLPVDWPDIRICCG